MDEHGRTVGLDCYGAPLTFSGADADVAALATLSAAYLSPYDGSSLSLGIDQAVPLQREWLGFTRIRARVDQPVPIRWPLFGFGGGDKSEAAGAGGDAANATTKRRRVVSRAKAPRPPLAVLHLRGRGGAVRGDLPPYEAFPLGGTNSVRGYADGGVASGRAFVEGTAELRFSVKPPFHGVVFVDGGSDLGTGESVVGDPAGARGKPGAGAAAGVGVRIDTPLGPLRLESAWNDKGARRFHLGIGFD
jgi:outer membrane protein insertion porin family